MLPVDGDSSVGDWALFKFFILDKIFSPPCKSTQWLQEGDGFH